MKQFQVQTYHPLFDVTNFLNEDGWNYEAIGEVVPVQVVNHVRDNLRFFLL